MSVPTPTQTEEAITVWSHDFEVECESRIHSTSVDHSGDAVVLQIGPCEHTTGFRCAGWVAYISAHTDYYSSCGTCGQWTPRSSLSWIPIPPIGAAS